jgi:hypothetical protein
MDPNEIIALGIVGVAVLLAIRYFIKQKGGNGCSKDCFSPKDLSAKK